MQIQLIFESLLEIGGDLYPSLEAAQAAALEHVAQMIANEVRQGIARQDLAVVNRHVTLTSMRR